nr:acyl-CoA dehydrogenase family protein [Mycobacterium sp. NAZ190054]
MTELRHEVRAFLRERIEAGAFLPGVDTWLTKWDASFTTELARRGFVGMTIPEKYGGHGRSHLERFVVVEELLAHGAPVAAQWVADRQIAPSLLRFGSEEQKMRYLPGIAAGEVSFGIGMSEPDSGSDLASVRTTAKRVAGGWSLSGTKVWTSGAHESDAFFALARSAPRDPDNRHAGLSQFIVDLRSPGVEIRPIISMAGAHHFNEVHLDGVFVPDDMVLGTIGDGWRQVTSELGFERSGPERFLSSFVLFATMLELTRTGRLDVDTAELGRIAARLTSLHHASLAVAGALQRGDDADTAAAIVKVLGTALEKWIVELADLCAGPAARQDNRFEPLLVAGLRQRAGFTLRGGTNEILKVSIAKGMGAGR